MKHLAFCLLAFLFSCSGKTESETSFEPKPPTEKRPNLSWQSPDIENSEPSPLFDSLMKDFNLKTFFTEMQFTNNGGANDEIYYFRPQREGFYYSYFGSPHYGGDMFGKLTLTTYIFGSTVGLYNEQDEELIEINCQVREPALGKLDLVGKPVGPFKKQDSQVYISNQRIILQENEQMLQLFYEDDTIRSFRYLRVKNAFSDLTKDEREAL